MRFSNDDFLSPARDQAKRLPCAQNPAYGVQCRSRHPRNVEPGYWKINQHSIVRFAARLIGEAQKRVGDTSLDRLGRHFHNPRLRFLKARAERAHGVDGKRGVARQQAWLGAVRPSENQAVDDGCGGRRIGVAPDRHRNPKHFARRDETDDDLFAAG